ncbi:MAG: septum formation protein Maf [Bdellovibrionales bacterium]|nr:septum formation protein Maf [Bdellovibrionales bacterium]
MKKIVLASTSPYRKSLLKRLAIPFEAQKPTFDEELYASTQQAPKADPVLWAQTLAFLKAQSLVGPGLTVIGADQLVSFQGQILGKPKTRENAIIQLEKMQNQTHELITAVCVLDDGTREFKHEFVNITKLTLRKLSRIQIENYVNLDQPLDCAGAYKIESHGIALIQDLDTQDPTAIEGLPLIQLLTILKECGYESFNGTA